MEHAFDEDYWHEIWSSDRAVAMRSSPPNPHLVREISGLTPGSALDAGSGAGAEAIWLASRGWTVTAADVAEGALAFGRERADEAGVGERVVWVQADLSTWEPGRAFELVTTHYAHPAIPQLEFYLRIASWVAPGGTLLIVGHLHRADGAQGHGHGGQPPAEASATAATITGLLDTADWEIATAEESERAVTRPGGAVTTLHDVVVRATRRE